jgi:hypothetical protein
VITNREPSRFEVEPENRVETRRGQPQNIVLFVYLMAVLEVIIPERIDHVKVTVVDQNLVARGDEHEALVEGDPAQASLRPTSLPTDCTIVPANDFLTISTVEIDEIHSSVALSLERRSDYRSSKDCR